MLKYMRISYWSEADGCWVVEIPELTGCQADGDTLTEALNNADVIIEEWIETSKRLGREIPEPINEATIQSVIESGIDSEISKERIITQLIKKYGLTEFEARLNANVLH